MIAATILLNAFYQTKLKNYIKSAILIVIAFGFHKSALFFCVVNILWLIKDSELLKKLRLAIAPVSVILVLYYSRIAIFLVEKIPFIPRRYIENIYLYTNKYNYSYAYGALYIIG